MVGPVPRTGTSLSPTMTGAGPAARRCPRRGLAIGPPPPELSGTSGPSRRRAEGPSTRGPPREGPGNPPGKPLTHRSTPVFLRRERPHGRTWPSFGPRFPRPRAERDPEAGRSPRVDLARTTMVSPPTGPSRPTRMHAPENGPPTSGRPARKESEMVHDHALFLARRPDRHDGRRIPGRARLCSTSTASWCGPCRRMHRPGAVETLVRKGYPVGSIDIDHSPELRDRYQINAVPAFRRSSTPARQALRS